jgi:hypothetical protein
MQLLTQELRTIFQRTYPLGSQDGKGDAAKVVAKFFFPAGRYTLFVTEGGPEGNDFLFFGYCLSALGEDCDEWGYSSLSELESVFVAGLRMERDRSIRPGAHTVGELRSRTIGVPASNAA